MKRSTRTAIVLAGGESRRMGRDKAFLEMHGRTLIEIVIERLVNCFSSVLISGGPSSRYEQLGCEVVPDEYEGAGALGGICSAVAASPSDSSFVVACDMPFVNPQVVQYLESFADEFDVVIPALARGPEPLHAFYSKACVPFMRAAIEAGDYKIINFFPKVRVKRVAESEWETLDPEGLSFLNINTPADFQRALDLLKGKKP